MEAHPPIQAADMLAWGRTRFLSAKPRRFNHLIQVLNGIMPTKVLELTEARLRAKHPPHA